MVMKMMVMVMMVTSAFCQPLLLHLSLFAVCEHDLLQVTVPCDSWSSLS